MSEQPPPDVPIILVFAHANGFNKEVWAAVLEEFYALAPAEFAHRLTVRQATIDHLLLVVQLQTGPFAG